MPLFILTSSSTLPVNKNKATDTDSICWGNAEVACMSSACPKLSQSISSIHSPPLVNLLRFAVSLKICLECPVYLQLGWLLCLTRFHLNKTNLFSLCITTVCFFGRSNVCLNVFYVLSVLSWHTINVPRFWNISDNQEVTGSGSYIWLVQTLVNYPEPWIRRNVKCSHFADWVLKNILRKIMMNQLHFDPKLTWIAHKLHTYFVPSSVTTACTVVHLSCLARSYHNSHPTERSRGTLSVQTTRSSHVCC